MRVHVTAEMRAELEALHAKHGKLNEDILVRASKRATSSLHSLFLWDDPDAAAAIGRREIARYLICSVKILPSEAKELQCSVRMRKFYGLGEGYRSIQDIAGDKRLYADLLVKAMSEMESFTNKYQMLSELSDVFAAYRRIKRRRDK